VKSGIQNWKTTVIGAAIAGLYALQNANDLTLKHALVTFAIAAFGFVCADGSKGGGEKSVLKVQS
jgi:tRNA U34 5-carboxymethylaminomethyl modifying enzyme MnmG/GidA